MNSEQGADSGDELTTEMFLAFCYRCGLNNFDLDDMTIGMCIDYIEEYLELINPEENQESNVREATQADFDRW